MDEISGVDGLGEPEEGAVLVKGGGDTDVDGGVVAIEGAGSGEDNVVAEALVQGADNGEDGVIVKSRILDGDVVDVQSEIGVVIGGLGAVEVKVDDLRDVLGDDGLDAAVKACEMVFVKHSLVVCEG